MKLIAKKSFAMVPAIASVVTITKELKNPGHMDKGEELTVNANAKQFSDLTKLQQEVVAQLFVTGSVVDAANAPEVEKIEKELKLEAKKEATKGETVSLEEKIATAVATAVATALAAAGVVPKAAKT